MKDQNRATKGSFLNVSPHHQIYYEDYGCGQGTPVLFVHGGPGAGFLDRHKDFFNEDDQRVIFLDQRGAGKSKAKNTLIENNTSALISDFEKLREHLQISKWHIVGGSWGSTLSLSYAIEHADRIESLILWGVFLLRPQDLDWIYDTKGGAANCFPSAYDRFRNQIPKSEQGDLLGAYAKRIHEASSDEQALHFTREWVRWELQTSFLYPSNEIDEEVRDEDFVQNTARIETHYFKNRGFFETEDFLLQNKSKYSTLPAKIFHGRYDLVCPPRAAYDLCENWDSAQLQIVEASGHSEFNPTMKDALKNAFKDCR